MKEIPVYIVEIDEESEGVNKVSLVENPAFEQNFVYYATINMCEVVDIEKRIIFAPIILADYPVLRDQAPFGMHYAYYTPATIEKIVNKYHKEKNTDKVNIHHQTDVEGVYMVQSFIKDSSKGVDPKEFPEVNDGSWFGAWHVENDDVWNGIKDGTFNGPSMEIVHSYRDSGKTLELMFNTNYKSMSKSKLNAVERFKRRQSFVSAYSKVKGSRPLSSKYGSMWTSAGELAVDGDFEEGKEVFLYADGDEPVVAPDGTYTVTDGDMTGYNIVVSAGVIESISDPNETQTQMEEEKNAVEQTGTEGTPEDLAEKTEELAIALLEEIQELKDAVDEYSKVEVVTKGEFKSLYSLVEGIAKAIKMPVQTPAKPVASSYQAPDLSRDDSTLNREQRANRKLSSAAMFNANNK